MSWLQDHIEPDARVYLWGNNVAPILLAGLEHVPDTFFTHVHLQYWSDIEDISGYVTDFILDKRPEYIIEIVIVDPTFRTSPRGFRRVFGRGRDRPDVS